MRPRVDVDIDTEEEEDALQVILEDGGVEEVSASIVILLSSRRLDVKYFLCSFVVFKCHGSGEWGQPGFVPGLEVHARICEEELDDGLVTVFDGAVEGSFTLDVLENENEIHD